MTARLVALLLASAAFAGDGSPPNIVLLLADDLGWNDLAVTGHGWHHTPRLDALAGEGLTFETAYAPAPNCAPSRASLLTGLYSPRHGIYTVGTSERGHAWNRRIVPTPTATVLPGELDTLAELLTGYRCASIGKWHLGNDPRDQGFQHAVAGNAKGHPPTYHSPFRLPDLEDGPAGEHLTERMGREAVAFLESLDEGQPFFLYLPFFAVHTPIQPPKGRLEVWKERLREVDLGHLPLDRAARYAALVEAMDTATGQVLDALERLGLAENTLVVFTSDNGSHARFADPSPLRGSKGMLYEGGLRVPLILRWPGAIEPGTRSDVPAHLVDLLPTLRAATGLDPVQGDGIDLGPIFSGGTLPDRDLHWHFPVYLEAYLPEQGLWRTTPGGAMRRGSWKAIEFFEDDSLELYELARDPGETTDVAAQHPDRVREMRNALAEWRERTSAPVPREPNPRYGDAPQKK